MLYYFVAQIMTVLREIMTFDIAPDLRGSEAEVFVIFFRVAEMTDIQTDGFLAQVWGSAGILAHSSITVYRKYTAQSFVNSTRPRFWNDIFQRSGYRPTLKNITPKYSAMGNITSDQRGYPGILIILCQ